ESRTIRADEVYYHTGRNVAIALNADMEIKEVGVPEPVHIRTPELNQLNAKLFEVGATEINASKLPYDAGLKVTFTSCTIEEITVPKQTIFGVPYTDPKTGLPEQDNQRIFQGRNMILYLGGVPIFYLPYLAGNVNDPLGPIDNLSFNYNKIFGFQLFT